MQRYYLRETGYDFSKRLAMGELLHDDGSVYNPVMATDQTFNTEDIHQKRPTVVADGYDIKIDKVSKDDAYINYAKATLIFWQNRGDTKEVVASISLQAHELDKLKKMINAKLDAFQTD